MAATTRSGNNAIAMVAMTLATAALLGAGGAKGSAATVSCGDVVSALVPCGGFLTGAGPDVPPAGCCQGAQSLLRMATTADARRDMCRCMVRVGPSFGVVPARVRALPARCDIAIDMPGVGGATDCNKIS